MNYHGKIVKDFFQNVATAGTPVTAAAYTEVMSVAENGTGSRRISIGNSSDQNFIVAFGGAGSEVDQFYLAKGVYSEDILIPEGIRVSVKAALATTTSGELVLNFFG